MPDQCVFEEMHEKIAAQHPQQSGIGGKEFQRFGDDVQKNDAEHEAGAERNEISEIKLRPLAADHEKTTEHVAESGGEAQQNHK
jgi:hypothetical protein